MKFHLLEGRYYPGFSQIIAGRSNPIWEEKAQAGAPIAIDQTHDSLRSYQTPWL